MSQKKMIFLCLSNNQINQNNQNINYPKYNSNEQNQRYIVQNTNSNYGYNQNINNTGYYNNPQISNQPRIPQNISQYAFGRICYRICCCILLCGGCAVCFYILLVFLTGLAYQHYKENSPY